MSKHPRWHIKGKDRRQDEAKTRQVAYDLLTVDEKIKRLDVTLGVGVGAKRQREKF